MEFYLGPKQSDDDLEGETSGKFILVSKEGQSYLIPMTYAPDKKGLAIYLNGHLRASQTPCPSSKMRIHLLIHTRHSVHLATTHVPTVDDLQTEGWTYLSETASTASGSS